MTEEISYGRRLTQLADAQPDQIAVHHVAVEGHETSLTWSQLEARSNQTAVLLAGRGVGQDDVVAIGLTNSFAHLFSTFASWKLGASVLPLRWDLPRWERERLLETAGTNAVIADWDHPSPGTIGSDDIDATTSLPADPHPDRVAACARMIASSGSTGRPKIIVTAHPGIYTATEGTGLTMGLGERDTFLATSPLYHVNGFMYCYSPLLGGQLAVLLERFDAARVVDVIERHRVQHTTMVPTMLQRVARLPDIASRDLSSLERLVYGGASAPDWVVETWLDLIPPERFVITYGGSEGIGICMTTGDQWLAHRGTCGQPLNAEVRILDEDKRPLPPNEIGEIHLRQIDVTPSFRYLGQATPEPTDDGFRTYGDLGYVDDDGFVYVVDRREDMIVSGGANVFPAEVEAAISEHRSVADTVVIGLADPEWGHRVHALVLPSDPSDPPLGDELRRHCRDRLAPYKVPKSFEVVDFLPRSDAGKINRGALARERADD